MLPNSYRAPALDEPALRMLNKYRLLGQLAKGGMAEVFLARADGLGGFQRLLVIKRILPELASDAEFVRMFLDEARIAATLHHTNIVQVFDVDMADGQVFYVMEHLHGQDVDTVVRRMTDRAARLPLGNAIAITAAVAAGLHYAHERCSSDGQPLHIVHRDVAPNNVIVTYDGNVKLIDFGIAKAVNNLSRTRFGLFKGKLPYASPEQCRCEPLDRRSDVFSLGVLLYELTLGQRLFTADNEYELIRVVSEAVIPRPRLRDKSYPRELEAIVLQALAAVPDQRYESAQALQQALEVFAVKQQLDLSAMSLSRLMETLFNHELLQWRSAERAGLTLEQHIITTTTSGRPREPSPQEPTDEASALAPTGTHRRSSSPPAAPSAPAEASVAAPPAVSPAISPPPSIEEPTRSDPASVPRRERSRVARYVMIATGAAVFVGLGALGALWWTQPMDAVPAAAPAATSRMAADPVPAPAARTAPVIDPAPAPVASAAAPVIDPAAAPASAPAAPPATDPTATPAAAAATEPATAPVTPPQVEPSARPSAAAPVTSTSDEAADPDRAPSHPSRRPKRLHPRAARPQAASEPAPDGRAHRPLDDATLDEVAPRSTRSP